MAIRGWAARGPKQKLEPFSYDPGPLGGRRLRSLSNIAVFAIRICRSSTTTGACPNIRSYQATKWWGESPLPVIMSRDCRSGSG